MDIEGRLRLRTRFMHWLYESTGGRTSGSSVDTANFDRGGISDRDLNDALEYLSRQDLLWASWNLDDPYPQCVGLTHRGLLEMEAALRTPQTPTQHFAPISVLHVYGNIIGSNIRQGSTGSTQTIEALPGEKADIEAFIAAVRAAIREPEFDPVLKGKVESDVAMIEAEVRRQQPRWKLVRALGQSLRLIVESGLGGVLTQALAGLGWPTP
ncbi:hypothetical protein Cs7R123_47990 [Catellatospora sp. TT07R-123]|nr:hypothetical protein Cs7R123_47990 [Catellatospora sp. TT07R-123]